MLNTAANYLDRHLPQRGDQLALISDSAMTGEVRRFTYRELREYCGALRRCPRPPGRAEG